MHRLHNASFTIVIYLIAKIQIDLKQTSLSFSVPFKPNKLVPLSRSETGVLYKKIYLSQHILLTYLTFEV